MSEQAIDPDRVALSDEQLLLYFRKISFSFDVLTRVYSEQAERDNLEAHIVHGYTQRLRYTFDALLQKYRFDSQKHLRLDTTDSGFPHHYEFVQLRSDLELRDEKLAKLRSQRQIKQEMLNYMFARKEDPDALLSELAVRSYFDMLDADRLFLDFNQGPIEREDDEDGQAVWSCHWASFDSATNRPFIYLMSFTTSGNADLHNDADFRAEFFRTLRSHGSRAPKLNIVAASIDEALESVHPKMLKRIGLGPFHSSTFSEGLSAPLEELFRYGDDERRFALFVENEYLFSYREVVSTSLFSRDQVRQIFFIPQDDPALYDKGSSAVNKAVILPFKLIQHAGDQFTGMTTYPFDQKGEVHGI